MNTGQQEEVCESDSSDYVIALRDKELRDYPVELVPAKKLALSYSPRVAGEDSDYARMLAESEAEFPPILVHRKTMKVIDGAHRLLAVQLRGQEHVAARYFDGTEEDARLLSVAMNVAQGLPLSLQDRTAAAERIFTTHPQWSDRAVAAVAGLSAKKVLEIRRRTATDMTQFSCRIGRDGKTRPLSTTHGREFASQLIKENPGASLRQIAKQAGIAPATVADVRDRLRRGDDVVPPKQRGHTTGKRTPGQPVKHNAPNHTTNTKTPAELKTIFNSLRQDPSLRFNEMGRAMLRILDSCAVVSRDWQQIALNVPAHCKTPMSQLARGYAEAWRLLADELERDSTLDERAANGEPARLGA